MFLPWDPSQDPTRRPYTSDLAASKALSDMAAPQTKPKAAGAAPPAVATIFINRGGVVSEERVSWGR